MITNYIKRTSSLTLGLLFAVLIVVAPVAFVAPSAMAAAAIGSVGSWTTSSNALPQEIYNATSVTSNGYVYVMGGYDSNDNPLSTVYSAKLNSGGSVGSWTTSSNALPQALASATSVTSNGYVYVMGGQDGNGNLSTVYSAKLNSDGSVGSWTTSSNALPQVLSDATSVTSNGYVYVMSGSDNNYNPLSTVYSAKLNSDGSVGSWTTSSNALPQALASATSVTSNGYVYVMGGYDSNNQSISTVYSAKLNSDGSVGSWTTSSNALPQALSDTTSVTSNGFVYVMGGFGNNDVYSAKLNSDGSVGSWTTSSNALPQALAAATSVTSNGYVYVMGGFDSNYNALNTVYSAPLNFLNHSATPSTPAPQPVALDTPAGSNITSFTSVASSSIPSDGSYTYPLDLLSFDVSVEPGSTNQVTLTFQTDLKPNQVIARKYNTTTKQYSTVPGATITETTMNGNHALALSYSITDGGTLDQDGSVNGVIVDSVGLAVTAGASTTGAGASAVKSPDTGYGTPGQGDPIVVVMGVVAAVSAASGVTLLYRQRRTTS